MASKVPILQTLEWPMSSARMIIFRAPLFGWAEAETAAAASPRPTAPAAVV